MKNTKLVAVYGSLRSTMHNSYILKKSKFIGSFVSEPEYTMYNINGSYPALIKKGNTSIVLEVYEIDEDIDKTLDQLEGYNESVDSNFNYYNKEIIKTPYGDCFIYYFNRNVEAYDEVKIGDWVKYIEIKDKKEFNTYSRWDC